ncbi:hypothetical protein BH10BAC5_BH10BAC5_16070 [soil metagenome]
MNNFICSLFSIFLFISSIFFQTCQAQWVQTNGPIGGQVRAVGIKDYRIYAGIEKNAYSSTNTGDSWLTPNPDNLTNTSVLCFCPTGNLMYAGTNRGIYFTYTSPLEWYSSFSSLKASVQSLSISNSRILAGSDTILYSTTNFGANWTTTSLGNKYINSVAIKDGNEFAATAEGLYLSTNSGLNWSISELTNVNVHSITTNGNYIIAGTSAGIYYSLNNGYNWTSANLNNIDALVVSSDGNKIYSGSNNGIFYSDNLGLSWSQIPVFNNRRIESLIVRNDTLIAGTKDTVFTCLNNTSIKSQKSWIYFKTPGQFASIGNKIFEGWQNGVFSSNDQGGNWNFKDLFTSWIFSFSAKDNMLLAGSAPYLYLSTDEGMHWTISKDSVWIRAICFAGNDIYAGSGVSVLHSTNSGNSWGDLGFGEPVSALLVKDNKIFAGLDGRHIYYGIYISTNNGITWDSSGLNDKPIYCLASSGNYIYAGTSYGGLYISSDNGFNWHLSDLTAQGVMSICTSGKNIFASVYQDGIYCSTNNGTTWSKKNQGFPPDISPNQLYILNGFIYAGISNLGVWKRSISNIVGIENINNVIPSDFMLSQNYPNPFNPTTKINFSLPFNSFATLSVYNILGKEVQKIVNENLNAGSYSLDFDGTEFASGIYFYSLKTNGFSETKRMLLVK